MKKEILLFGLILSTLSYSNEKEVKLEKSVITSVTGFATDIRDVASNPKVVTSEEIQEKKYTSIGEIIADIPGINITYDNEGNPTVNMRGLGKDTSTNYRAEQNIKIMIDGIPTDTLDADFGGTPLTSIPVSSIERVEVIPGGGAVLYGSGTSGGVINIITKEKTGTRALTDYKYSQYGGNLVNVNAGHTIGKFDFDLTYSKEHGDGYREDTDKNSDSFIGKIRYNISDTQKLTLKYTNVDEKSHYAESLKKQQIDSDRTQNGKIKGSENFYEIQTEEVALSYNNKFTDNFEFNILGYHKERDGYQDYISSYGLKRNIEEWNEKKDGISGRGKYSYGNGSFLSFGTEYKEDKYKNPSKYFYRDISSAYVLNNLKFRENWDFITGVRYEKANYEVQQKKKTIKADEDGTSYEVGLNYLYSDTGNAYLKYEHSFLLPYASSLRNSIYDTGEVYYSGIKPSETNNYELGIRDYIGDTFITFAVYWAITKDEITKDISKFDVINYNIGETERKGIELSAEKEIGKLILRGSYNFVNSKINNGKFNKVDLSGTKMSNSPEHQITIGADYQLTNNLLIMADATYTSGVYPGNTSTKRGYDVGKQNENIVINLKTKYQVNESLNIYGGINNLFNEKYYTFVGQDKDSIDGLSYDPAPERNYYLGFSYTF